MMHVDVYGTLCYTKDAPLETLIEGFGLSRKEQKWIRKELPSIFDDVEFDKDGVALLNEDQKRYALIEIDRCKNGYWFFNNGVPTYITGKHYFYLQWWKLEDDIYPDYRDADRRYYRFLAHWENVLWCIGIARGKKRREGASSQATANLIYECIFYTNSNCGLVSKTEKDSKETFVEMVAFGYSQLPVFLKPRQLNRADSVTELKFGHKSQKGGGATKGQNSKVNFRAPVENAYDRGRMTRVLADEGGKWPLDVKFSKFISKVTKTMVKGAKRVGFCEAPSTVNELTKGGGMEFKKFWDNANQFKAGGRKTNNRFVTYFTPAFDNYEGFIDEHGMSVIDAPTEEQYEYLVARWVIHDPNTNEVTSELNEQDIRLGARAYIASRRVGLDGDLLEEEIRQNPCTVDEMFEAAIDGCVFNMGNINARKKELEEAPVYKRTGLYRRELDGSVKWYDVDPKKTNFFWETTYFPELNERGKYYWEGREKAPGRTDDGAISVDGYSNSQGGRKYGSKACAWIGRRFNIMDPKNTGKAVGRLYGRPKQKEDLHEQVMLAAEFYGYKVWYEHNADDYLGYFRDRGKVQYLGSYPLSTIDRTKQKEPDRWKGFPTTPFSLTKQLDTGIAYFEHHCDLIDWVSLLDNAVLFDPYDRTKYDEVVAFLILLVVLMEPAVKPPPRKIPLVEVYENQMYQKAG